MPYCVVQSQAAAVGHAADADRTIRHRVEGVLVLRAGRVCPRVHFGGQEKHGDTSHRDEHDDDEYPAAAAPAAMALATLFPSFSGAPRQDDLRALPGQAPGDCLTATVTMISGKIEAHSEEPDSPSARIAGAASPVPGDACLRTGSSGVKSGLKVRWGKPLAP